MAYFSVSPVIERFASHSGFLAFVSPFGACWPFAVGWKTCHRGRIGAPPSALEHWPDSSPIYCLGLALFYGAFTQVIFHAKTENKWRNFLKIKFRCDCDCQYTDSFRRSWLVHGISNRVGFNMSTFGWKLLWCTYSN